MHGHNKQNFFWFFSIIVILFLSGCATQQTMTNYYEKDGPPPYDVDVSKIPNAQPKNEPLAKYGNMKKYRVHGRAYHVMKDARNYEECGIASWYGMKFHAQRTSSGEPYNLLAMTAAHKTLPLPTYVEVTNLENNRKIIVKVNDRGPFASNRIIDLSYVAAKKLGMLGRGTAYVNIKTIDSSEAFSHRSMWAQKKNPRLFALKKVNRSHMAKGSNYLQVGAFKNKMYAEKLKIRLQTIVSSPVEVTHLSGLSKNFYRVKIGPIHDLATVETIQKKLRLIGLTPKHIKV